MHSLSLAGPEFTALAAELLHTGRVLRFQAHGGSMFPLICHGDVIEVQPVHPSAIQRGDVVLCYQANGRVLAHRVIRVNREQEPATVVTQGDALTRADGCIPVAQVLGRVVAVERRGKRFRLDTAWQRRWSRFWLTLAPLRRWGYRAVVALWRKAHHSVPSRRFWHNLQTRRR